MSTVYRRKVRRPSGELVPSRFYWCSWHHPERGLVRESTKCVDKRAAEAFVRARERTAHSPDPAAHSTPLRVAIATYKSAKKGAGRAKGTLAMIDQKSAHLARLLGDETLVRSISPADVDRYVSTRQAEGAANNTIAKELSTLIGLLKLAARHGLCEHPARLKPLDFAAGYVPRRTCLASPEALRKLLFTLEPHRAAHVAFIVATSANWSESVRAQRADVRLDVGLVKIRGTKTATRAREVPIVGFARALLAVALERAPGKGAAPLFERWINVRRDLHAACKRAGIPAVSPNDLRRTFGTWLRAEGVEPHLIGAAMGHADSRMVERVYGRIDATDLRRQLVARVGDEGVETAQRHGDEARRTGTSETTVVVIPREILCPGAESNRRHADFQSRRTGRGAGKIVRIGALTRPDGTKLHTPSARTFGELLDQALSLGKGRAS